MLAAHAPVTLAQILDYPPERHPAAPGALAAVCGRSCPDRRWARRVIWPTTPGLSATARCTGNIGYQPDADGVLRRLPVLTAIRGRDYPMFAAT